MEEVWKDVKGYEGRYQVSNFGNVMSLNYRRTGKRKLLTPKINNDGRLWVALAGNGKPKPMLIHRLVATAFIENPNNYPQINHIDENPKNNCVENLEWCTQEYNIGYYYERYREDAKRKKYRHGKHMNKAVIQETKDGRFVRKWNNSRQTRAELGWNDWSIAECCRGNRKTAYGYIWRYAS